MSTTTSANPSLYLDGKPFESSEATPWTTFEEICISYTNHLHNQGRAILSVKLDGIEIDCSTPPTQSSLFAAKKIEVESCLFEELIQHTLKYHVKLSEGLSQTMLELSTDCLIQTPQETFAQWKDALETLKSLVGFIPKFFSLQPFATPAPDEVTEEYLTKHIHNIQDTVEVCRKAWDVQDVVLFSDTVELRIGTWLKSHINIADKLLQSIHLQVEPK
jgi:hypothetical protein